MPRPLVTLCSDFGLQDHFIGAMKGVILSICPEANLIDITHEIQPQGVQQAAFTIAAVAPYFPSHTVHLVVVDPGVGTGRRPIAVFTVQATYVAPDNGVLSMVLARESADLAIHLTDPAYHLSPVSATFHGRDVFASAAAHLASGVYPHQMGEVIPLSEITTLPLSIPVSHGHGVWMGEVLHADRFGNLVTNFRCTLQGAECHFGRSEIGYRTPEISLALGDERITGLSRTFAEVEPGEMLVYLGSSGYLEIAVREGSAADRLGIKIGDPVSLELPSTNGLASQPGLGTPHTSVSGTTPSAGNTSP